MIHCISDGLHVSLPAGNDHDREIWNFIKAASTMCYMQASFTILDKNTIVSIFLKVYMLMSIYAKMPFLFVDFLGLKLKTLVSFVLQHNINRNEHSNCVIFFQLAINGPIVPSNTSLGNHETHNKIFNTEYYQ